MARKKWSLNVNILVIIIGVLTILLGTYIVSSTHVYTLVLFGKRIEVAQRSFSFLTIFDGFFLIVFGYLLTGKTRTSFRIINISLIITFLSSSVERIQCKGSKGCTKYCNMVVTCYADNKKKECYNKRDINDPE